MPIDRKAGVAMQLAAQLAGEADGVAWMTPAGQDAVLNDSIALEGTRTIAPKRERMGRVGRWAGIGVTAAIVGAVCWWLLDAWAQGEREAHLEQQRLAIEQAVLRRLEDPGPATFTNVKYYRQSKGGCGYVSSRDSHGEWTGLVAFVVTGDKEVHFEPEVRRGRTIEEQTDQLELQAQFRDLQTATCNTYDELV